MELNNPRKGALIRVLQTPIFIKHSYAFTCLVYVHQLEFGPVWLLYTSHKIQITHNTVLFHKLKFSC